MFKNDTPYAQRLELLLADERRALLSGDFGSLTDFIQAKEQLLSKLERAKLPAEDLRTLREAAASNQSLLDAALKGVQAARQRIEMAKNGGPSFSTYNAQGNAMAHNKPSSKIERRA